jgi:hypothetical protein
MDEISDMNDEELEQALEAARAEELRRDETLDDLFDHGVEVDSDEWKNAEMEVVEATRLVASLLLERNRRAADLSAAEDEGTFREGFLRQERSMRRP